MYEREKLVSANIAFDMLLRYLPDSAPEIETVKRACEMSIEIAMVTFWAFRLIFRDVDPRLYEGAAILIEKSELSLSEFGIKLAGYLRGRSEQARMDGKIK